MPFYLGRDELCESLIPQAGMQFYNDFSRAPVLLPFEQVGRKLAAGTTICRNFFSPAQKENNTHSIS